MNARAAKPFYRVPGSLVYHTWLDCPKLEQANEFDEISEEAERLRECRTCKYGW